jgi:hypothetical protein
MEFIRADLKDLPEELQSLVKAKIVNVLLRAALGFGAGPSLKLFDVLGPLLEGFIASQKEGKEEVGDDKLSKKLDLKLKEFFKQLSDAVEKKSPQNN